MLEVLPRFKNQNINSNVYVGMSDGECQEGMTWEAAMSIAHYKLDNIIAFIDYNNIQIDGYVSDVMNVGDLSEKFASFGWLTKVSNGHDQEKIHSAFEWARKDGEKIINKEKERKIRIREKKRMK
eukprot:UN14288